MNPKLWRGSYPSFFKPLLSGPPGHTIVRSGPEVELSPEVKAELTRRFREIDRRQMEAFISARDYFIGR